MNVKYNINITNKAKITHRKNQMCSPYLAGVNMKPLEGITIIDLTTLLPGGYCTLILSDLGAKIIKVEPPGGDPIRYFPPFIKGVSVYHHIINRDKESITLNLRKEEDKKRLLELIRGADAVIDNFRAKTAKKLGLDYEVFKSANPEIVHCSIRGHIDEKIDKPIHDLNAQGLSGITYLMKWVAGKPSRNPVPISDLAAGLNCALTTVASIFKAKREGTGARIIIGMVESAAFFNILAFANIIGGGNLSNLIGVGHKAYYDVYETKDGKYFTVASIEDKFWDNVRKFFDINNEREGIEAYEELRKRFKMKTSDEIKEYFKANPSCVEEVLNVDEALEYDGIKEFVASRDGIRFLKYPFKIVFG